MRLGLKLGLDTNKPAGGSQGLLDQFPGAVAAYSFRSLNSNHAGDKILIERSEGSPSEQGLSTNLDSGITSFCSGVTGNLKTWYDQTGNENNLTENTFANQPKIHDSSSGNILNDGKLAIQFNGTSSKLVSADFSVGTACTIFIVAQSTTITDRYYLDGKSANNRLGLYAFTSNTLYQLFTTTNSGSASVVNSNSKTTVGNNVLLTIIKNGSSSALYENGVQVATGILTTDDFIGLILGARFNTTSFYPDKMQEVIIYNSDQSANRAAIEEAINNYYEIY